MKIRLAVAVLAVFVWCNSVLSAPAQMGLKFKEWVVAQGVPVTSSNHMLLTFSSSRKISLPSEFNSSRWSVGVHYNLITGGKAEFSRSSFSPVFNGVGYTYPSEGKVEPDTFTSSDGKTWNVDINNQSQIFSAGGGVYILHHGLEGSAVKSESSDLQHGMEVTITFAVADDDKWRTSAEFSLGWSRVNYEESNVGFGKFITHSRPLVGGLPPTAFPYTGVFDGATFDTPLTTLVPEGTSVAPAPITINRSLRGNTLTLRVGPKVQYKMLPGLTLSVEGGGIFGVERINFNYLEILNGGGLSRTMRGSDKTTSIVYGGYLGADIGIAITENVFWKMGAIAMHLNDARLGSGDHQARLRRSLEIIFRFGVVVEF